MGHVEEATRNTDNLQDCMPRNRAVKLTPKFWNTFTHSFISALPVKSKEKDRDREHGRAEEKEMLEE